MVQLASSYPLNLFPGVRRIRLDIVLPDHSSGEGALVFDPNIITFNDFGDQVSTTYMLFQGYKVQAELQTDPDPTNKDRKSYLLKADGLQGGLPACSVWNGQ